MREYVIFAIMNLKQHKIRTVLSGIAIAIASFLVSFTLVIGNVVRYTVSKGMEILGMNEIIVDTYDWEKEKVISHRLKTFRKPIGMEEFSALKGIGKLGLISRCKQYRGEVEFKGRVIKDVDILGVDPAYFGIRNYKIEYGRSLNFGDNLGHVRVCVIGSEVAEKIGLNSLPAFIEVEGKVYEVVGILKRMGEVLQNKPDNVVLIPFNSLGMGEARMTLHIVPFPGVDRDSLKNLIRTILEKVRSKYGESGKFGINDMEEVFSSFRGMSIGITRVVSLFAIIALFVGGIGIANVMLASARERIHEVGILKSLGLSNEEVFWMFITESIILSLIGAIIGIILGYLLAYLLLLLNSKGLILHISFFPVLLSLLMTILTGFLAGLYPAIEASRREVVEALRYL